MYIHANAYKFAHNYVLHMCIHCGACTQKAQHPDTYTCTSTCSNICFCGATHAYMCMLYGHPKGCLVLLELGPLGAGGDRAAERRCHPTEPLLGTRRVPGQRETGGFFPPNKSTPHPSSWKPGPGASMYHTPGGASTSPHICSPELTFSSLLPNLQPPPWETSVVVYWKQLQPAVPKGRCRRLLFLIMV